MGRDDFLRDLRASLLKKTHATAITHTAAATGIAGLGGIGKTHAAVEYARRHQADYTATLFVSGDSSGRLDAGFSALFDTLHLGNAGEVQLDQAVRIAAVKDWFATHRDWLLIVDNVDDKAVATAFTGYLGSLTQGHVLITSRLQNWGSNVEALNIEVLSPEDSTDLLLQLTEGKRRQTDDEAAEARRLADLLEGLPLALHQAAGYINERRLTFTGYIAEYEEEAKSLLEWFESHIIPYERPDMLAPRPVLITWKTSFEKLDANTRRWLSVFAHYAPEPIPEFLLECRADDDDDVKAVLSSGLKALAQAEKYSLLNRFDSPPTFKLHRLVQQIIRLSATTEEQASSLEDGIEIIVRCDPGDPQDVRSWDKWIPLEGHASALCSYSTRQPPPTYMAWLLSGLGVLLYTKGSNGRAESLIREAIRIEEIRCSQDDPDIGTLLNSLANTLRAQNKGSDAEPLLRRALTIVETKLGKSDHQVAVVLNSLASVVQDAGRFSEAESLLRRALRIDEDLYDETDAIIARRLNNLASLLWAANRLKEAEPLIRRALHINEKNLGKNHPDVATNLNNLAQLLQTTNRLADAEPRMRSALAIDEASFGKDHPNVARDLNNLATLLQATNRQAEAEPLMRRALGIFVASLGVDHPKSQGVKSNLDRLLAEMG